MSGSRLGLALLLLATALLYWPVREFDFVGVDDPDYVTDNAEVLSGLTADGVIWAFQTGHAGNWHPLTWISHMVDVDLFGTAPAGHHLTNVVLHLANTWLLFTLLVLLTGCRGRSLFVAAVFALHPVHVESVAWISERKDVLSTFFGLLAILAWVLWTRARTRVPYLLALVCLTLSLMSKPMLVTLPALLLLLDIWPLGRWRLPGTVSPAGAAHGERLQLRGLVWEKLPLAALCLGSSAITWWVQRSGGAMESSRQIELGARLANGVVALVRYVGLTFWPAQLGLLHPHPDLPGGTPLEGWQVLGACALLLLATVLAWRGRRVGWPLVGWLWFVGLLVPVIGLVQVGDQALAERYLYLPQTGLALIVAWGAAALLGRRGGQLLLVLGLLAALAMTAVSWRQVGHWRTSVSLLEQALTVAPRSPTLHVALGHDLEKLGRHDEAIAQFEAALREAPGHPGAHHYLAVALRASGRTEEAVQHYRQALASDGANPRLHYNLAIALGALDDGDGAIAEYRAALSLDPDSVNALANLGAMLILRGDWAGAEQPLNRCLRLDPGQSGASCSLARVFIEQGRPQQAERCLRDALQLDTDSAALHDLLGRLLSTRGRCVEALAHLERALKAAPRALGTALRAAWIYAAHPSAAVRNPRRALELARRVDELTGHSSALVLDTLAAALAANGDLEGAAAVAAEALQLADDPVLTAGLEERLQGYRQGRPALDPSLGNG